MLFCTISHKLNINITQTNPENKEEPPTKTVNAFLENLFGISVLSIKP